MFRLIAGIYVIIAMSMTSCDSDLVVGVSSPAQIDCTANPTAPSCHQPLVINDSPLIDLKESFTNKQDFEVVIHAPTGAKIRGFLSLDASCTEQDSLIA